MDGARRMVHPDLKWTACSIQTQHIQLLLEAEESCLVGSADDTEAADRWTVRTAHDIADCDGHVADVRLAAESQRAVWKGLGFAFYHTEYALSRVSVSIGIDRGHDPRSSVSLGLLLLLSPSGDAAPR